MLFHHALNPRPGALFGFRLHAYSTRRALHHDGRNRLSAFWTPTLARKNGAEATHDDGHGQDDLLVRAGYLRQAHSGIFHLLPLGLRVQNKIEQLIDKHMLALGASKLSLSSVSSEELWQRSGRLEGRGSEFFRIEDRKGAKFLLSPTHEEEITSVVANAVHSYKDLPLRLYQVSRKYRDEARPRHGLLRGREFLMKDLYTFDVTDEQARQTYDAVRKAYSAFLDELHLPYLVATADSGTMGGDLSHEYHFASAKGEDTIIHCGACSYSINQELFIGQHSGDDSADLPPGSAVDIWFAVSKDRKTLLQVVYPKDHALNLAAIKAIFPTLDAGVENAQAAWQEARTAEAPGTEPDMQVLFDPRVSEALAIIRQYHTMGLPIKPLSATLDGSIALLTQARPDDPCPDCADGRLRVQKAVEVGHTFHLGTRYSAPLALNVLDANNASMPVSMGCHGLGISRLIGAVAGLLADGKGLNWPLAIAPFSTVLVATSGTAAEDVHQLYDELTAAGPGVNGTVMDAVIDDRERPVGWKLHDADLIGYPFLVVLGKGWQEKRVVEVQCRRLEVKEEVGAAALVAKLEELGAQLHREKQA